jgi:cytidylate kinase
MAKRKIISMAGDLGSGKSTVANMICEKLSYPIHKNGDYFRRLGKRYGLLREFKENAIC